MSKPVADWNEEFLLSLPLGEQSTFERKGSKLLDLTLPDVSEDKVRDELAKQLSAFANTGGGAIIYGLTNDGLVDVGGISRNVKGRRSTKEWLEDIIPELVEFEILGFNVFEVRGNDSTSAIDPQKSLYVIDIPDSDRAPHQSRRDSRYYVRLAGRSQPAPHRLIEDIRNRARHPNLILKQVELTHVGLPRENLPRVVGALRLLLRWTLHNVGWVKATNACVACDPQGNSISISNQDSNVVRDRIGIWQSSSYLELQHPIYPQMETVFYTALLTRAELLSVAPGSTSRWRVSGKDTACEEIAVSWTIFADSAPPKSGKITLQGLNFVVEAMKTLEGDPAWPEISKLYPETK